MRLTKQTNYAVRMLMYCAASEGLVRVSEVARFFSLPEPFMTKIQHVLKVEGFIETVRGRKGGMRLARPPAEIGLGEIVRSVEESFALAECFGESESCCPLVTSCGLNGALARALDAFLAVLDEVSLADLASSERNLNVLVQLNAMTGEAPAPSAPTAAPVQ